MEKMLGNNGLANIVSIMKNVRKYGLFVEFFKCHCRLYEARNMYNQYQACKESMI